MTHRTKRKRKPKTPKLFELPYGFSIKAWPRENPGDVDMASMQIKDTCTAVVNDYAMYSGEARRLAAWLIKFAEWSEGRK